MHYIHFRRILDWDNGVIEARGGATVAFEKRGENAVVSVALCSTGDNFNKKIGRAISSGRISSYLSGNLALVEEGFIMEMPVNPTVELDRQVFENVQDRLGKKDLWATPPASIRKSEQAQVA